MKRKFFIGSDWLYYKIYSGLNVQEKLLRNEVYEIVHFLYAKGKINQFFFIRYHDSTGYHLRLRFHFTDKTHLAETINIFHEKFDKLLEHRQVNSICIDTYNRELERYGTSTIEDIEEIFSINSLAILNYLRRNNETIWTDIIPMVDEMLNQLSFSTEQKHLLMEDLYQNFYSRTNNNPELKKHIQDTQRQFKNEAELAINSDNWHQQNNAVAQRKRVLHILDNFQNNKNNPEFIKIVKSVIHMFFNRFYSYNQNTYEIVIYYMMSKLYKTISVKEQKKTSNKAPQ